MSVDRSVEWTFIKYDESKQQQLYIIDKDEANVGSFLGETR